MEKRDARTRKKADLKSFTGGLLRQQIAYGRKHYKGCMGASIKQYGRNRFLVGPKNTTGLAPKKQPSKRKPFHHNGHHGAQWPQWKANLVKSHCALRKPTSTTMYPKYSKFHKVLLQQQTTITMDTIG
jgi:hypothetical protein